MPTCSKTRLIYRLYRMLYASSITASSYAEHSDDINAAAVSTSIASIIIAQYTAIIAAAAASSAAAASASS